MDHVAFLRGYGRRDPDAVGRLAEALGISPGDARLMLGSKFPRRLSAHADIEEALAVVEKLRGVELDGFVVHRDELATPAVVLAGSAAIGDDAVSWTHVHRDGKASDGLGEVRDRNIRQTREHVKAVFLAFVRGTIQRETYEAQAVTVPLPGASVTVSMDRQTGGWVERDKQQILLVKGRGHAAFLLVSEAGFDYSCLGADRTYGSAQNLRKLVTRLKAVFPEARHDDSLLQYSGDMGAGVRSGSAASGAVSTSSSNFEAVLQMARLLSIQDGLE